MIQKKENSTHSKTMVHQCLHGQRTTMTIRVLPEIKHKFTERTRQLGLSTCHVAEGLFTGWLYGVDERVELVHQSPTIDLTLVRDVKRVRRYYKEVIEEERTVQKCTFRNCKNPAVARAIFIGKSQEHLVCDRHFEVVRTNPKSWKIIGNLPSGG